jgi:signal transduction histidine kinase
MRYVEESSDEELKKEIRAAQTLCEEAVAEDRQSVHALTRQSTEGRYQA